QWHYTGGAADRRADYVWRADDQYRRRSARARRRWAVQQGPGSRDGGRGTGAPVRTIVETMNARHAARDAALRVLYLCEIGGVPPPLAIATFFAEHAPESEDEVRTFTTDLVLGTVEDLDAIDELIARHSQHWRIERLAVLDRLILRMATWELRHRPDTP